MSSVSGSMKGFYRQKKNTNNISSSKSTNNKPPIHAPNFGSHVPQQPPLQDDYNESEAMLRQFDMNMAYGPCVGMSRVERWERAQKLGLNPPKEIERLLKTGKVQTESLWDGRI